MKTLDHSISSDHKFTKKEFAFIKSEMKKYGYKYDAWVGKFSKKDKYGTLYISLMEAYEKIAKFNVLSEIRTLLFQAGIKPTIANTGTLYIESLDVRISNHVASGYYHAEKFGFNKHDFVVGAFTNPLEVLEIIKSIK